jgi:hypothetical protein
MTPAASVSGLIFAHPAARYFTVGRIGKDQAADYAARRGLPLQAVEHWLRPNLAYDPELSITTRGFRRPHGLSWCGPAAPARSLQPFCVSAVTQSPGRASPSRNDVAA